jgi:hypothetical protein
MLALNVLFHVELHKAAKSLERLRVAGANPVVSKLSEEFLRLASE